MHLLVFYKDIYQNARSSHQDSYALLHNIVLSRMSLWLLYEPGNNKTHRFYVNCPKVLFDFNQIWIFREFFIKISIVEFRGYPSSGGRAKYMGTDGQTDKRNGRS
jgi:hypothetical protein